jgi:hypothetical protein
MLSPRYRTERKHTKPIDEVIQFIHWPFRSSGGYSPAYYRGGPGSSPIQDMWDLWRTKLHWGSFLRVLRFPLPILIPPTAPHSSSSTTRGWYSRPAVAAVPSGLLHYGTEHIVGLCYCAAHLETRHGNWSSRLRCFTALLSGWNLDYSTTVCFQILSNL